MKFYKYAIVCLIALLIMTYIDVDKEDVYKEYVYASNEIIIDEEKRLKALNALKNMHVLGDR